MQKLGIIFDTCSEISDEKRIALMQKNGFEATFLMANDPLIDKRAPLLKKAGITIENCHAPFDGINLMWHEQKEVGDSMLLRLTESLENCARHEIPLMVCHLSSGENPPRVCDAGHIRFDTLMEKAKALGVTVAFENQRKLGNLALAMETYPEAGFCFDTGHEACFTPGREYMPLFASRIVALHLHDNSALYNADDHILPYDGKADLERCARQLAKSPYDRAIMSESFKTSFYRHLSPEEYYALAAERVARFADRVAYYREKEKSAK